MDMTSRRGEIYHILYGDTDCRYLPLLNGFHGHRVIATYHQPPSELRKGVRESSVRRLTAALAVASNQVDFLAHLVGPERVFIVAHGVDTAYFVPNDGLRAYPPIVLSVGAHLRDFKTLSLAASIVGQQEPNARFIIVTHPKHVYHFAALSNVEVRSHLPDNELLRLYQQATLAVFALHDCTASNAMLEAMACGLPIVATDVGGVRDYVDETCARLISPGTAEGLASAIVELLADAGERDRLGTAARERAMRFSFARVAEQMRTVYEQILGLR